MENTKLTPIRFPTNLLADLERHIGNGNRSKFIVNATRKELHRVRQRKAVNNAAGIFDEKNYPDFKTPEDISAWVRKLRKESEARRRELFGE